MTDSLADILGRTNPHIPREITALKAYIHKEFGFEVGASISKTQIAIIAPNGSAATLLRMRLPDLQKTARTKLRLVIRIGRQ